MLKSAIVADGDGLFPHFFLREVPWFTYYTNTQSQRSIYIMFHVYIYIYYIYIQYIYTGYVYVYITIYIYVYDGYRDMSTYVYNIISI